MSTGDDPGVRGAPSGGTPHGTPHPGPDVPRPHRSVRIGLTGPIGCGKTTVGRWLAAAGAHVIDADAVAREVTAPGTPGHDEVLARFGSAVTAEDGTLDRAALARIVFADPERLRELERVVHPAVRRRILGALDAADHSGVAAVVVEAIKLVEGGLAGLCDEVWLVTCDPDAQRARMLDRGMDPDDADRRLAAQAGLAERLVASASRVVDTSGTPEETATVVRDALMEALGRRRA